MKAIIKLSVQCNLVRWWSKGKPWMQDILSNIQPTPACLKPGSIANTKNN